MTEASRPAKVAQDPYTRPGAHASLTGCRAPSPVARPTSLALACAWFL